MKKYPLVAVRKDRGLYEGTMPDFPGISVEADSPESLLGKAQGLVETWMLRQSPRDFPEPTPICNLPPSNVRDSVFMLADVDTSFVNTMRIRVNISVPAYALYIIDKRAKSQGTTRSEYMVRKSLE